MERSTQLVIKRAEAASRLRAAIDILSGLLNDLSTPGSRHSLESQSAPAPKSRRSPSSRRAKSEPLVSNAEETSAAEKTAIQQELRSILQNGVRIHVEPDSDKENEDINEDWENTEQYTNEEPAVKAYTPAGYSDPASEEIRKVQQTEAKQEFTQADQYNPKATAGSRRSNTAGQVSCPHVTATSPNESVYSAADELNSLNNQHNVQNLRAKWSALINNQEKK